MDKSSGNTKPRISQSKYWCFTSYNIAMDKWIAYFTACETKYIIGEETCPTTGKQHLQGYIESATYIRPMEKFKEKDVHWEKRKGTREQNIKYCSKEGNFRTNFLTKKKVGNLQVDKLTLVDWMLDILKRINLNRNHREIMWVWDRVGGKGKSRLCKYILEEYENVMYFTGGRNSDITSQIIESELVPELCLFDLPRSNEGHISYNALEQVKNGLVNSPKYKGGFKVFDSPHIIVFANFEPEKEMLSNDRWNIIELV